MTNEVLSPDPSTDRETGKQMYVVILGEKILAQTRVAVRADSEEDAARLALEGARYGMQSVKECEWEIYEFDYSVDTEIFEVETVTQDEPDSTPFQTHLLDAPRPPNSSPNEAHERAISKWKEHYKLS